MKMIKSYLNTIVEVEITGDKKHLGILIDIGQDILVLYNGKVYLYIPTLHVQYIQPNPNPGEEISNPSTAPIDNDSNLSFRKILQHARGQFVEVYVAGNQSLHGYVTNILTNYFVFYSPIFKTMYIPLNHLKWLIPYTGEQTPYSLDRSLLPVSPSTLALSRTFEEQLARLEGELVVFDLGLNPRKVGLLKKIQNNLIELITAEEKHVYWNLQHIKTLHSPKQL